MAEKKKVLLILNTINDYRVETYNIINKTYDFTVGYNIADQTKKECEFKKLKFDTKKIGPFHIFGRKFWQECKNYDAIITSFDLHNFEFAFIPFIKRKYKLLTWSIGFRCSYKRPYDVNRKHGFLDNIALRILEKADANIFYMEKAKEFWTRTKLDFSKVFIAPNTTSVNEIRTSSERKKSILFVGTLYKGKGVDKLIHAFAKSVDDDSNNTLNIVGDGDELNNLQEYAKEQGVQSKVNFLGAIYDEATLAKLFAEAFVCVSPTQAGLSVPKSMGYGVPFITKSNAITGGEIFHLENNVTGFIYNRDDELTGILRYCFENSEQLETMGHAARSYYHNFATPEHQAQGVIDAIEFAFK